MFFHPARFATEKAVFRPALPACFLPGITEMQMAAVKRKTISKKVRFEVFKRDGFSCQYCGAHPPAVLLHLDHVHPVSQGGENEEDNLITSCESCNQGKSDRLLSDIPQSLQDKAAQIIEREAQIKGYQNVVAAKRQRIEDECLEVVEVYERFNEGFTLSQSGLVSVRNFIEKIGVHEVIEAMELAYSAGNVRRGNEFKYFCGICWNKIRESA